MKTVEFTGKTTEEALLKAQQHFGLTLDQLNVEVLQAGGGGLFGLFKKKGAVVKVRPMSDSQEDHLANLMADFTGSEAPKAHKPAAAPAAPAAAPAAPAAPQAEPPRHTGPSYDKDHGDDAAAFEDAAEDEEGHSGPVIEDQSVVDDAQEVLVRLVLPLDDSARVRAENSDQGIMLDIDGQEAGVLIGRRGQTLDALQYLCTRIVSHKHGRPVRIHVDAGGYRKRRMQSLEDLALRLADKARDTGRPVSLGPICSQERRVVHMTLRQEHGISTVSRGRGELKKVVISPRR